MKRLRDFTLIRFSPGNHKNSFSAIYEDIENYAFFSELSSRLDSYISHINKVKEYISNYESIGSAKGEEMAKKFRILLSVLETTLPMKKAVCEEIVRRNKNGENYKYNSLFLKKFKNGHGIHEMKKALEYWNKEKFLQIPPTKSSVLKKKIIKSLGKIPSNALEGIRLIETPFPSFKDLVSLVIGEDKDEEVDKIDD